jgi:molecular chaperone GrpE
VNTTGEKDQKSEKDPAVRVVDRRWWARGDTSEDVGEAGSRKPTYIEDLEKRLADTTSQLQQVMNEHRRALEEFEQVKTRLRRDVGREVERGKRGLLGELLEVLDNLDRALSSTGKGSPSAATETQRPSAAPQDELERFVRGVQLVREQFLQKLAALGVARLTAVGQPFDAQKHEAVTTTPVDDPAQDGVVVAVIKEGYAIGDDVLRPASVVVGKLRG